MYKSGFYFTRSHALYAQVNIVENRGYCGTKMRVGFRPPCLHSLHILDRPAVRVYTPHSYVEMAASEAQLFNKWSYEDLEVPDFSLVAAAGCTVWWLQYVRIRKSGVRQLLAFHPGTCSRYFAG